MRISTVISTCVTLCAIATAARGDVWLRFEESQGGATALDSSADGNNGVLVNGASRTPMVPQPIVFPGIANSQSLLLDGNNDAVVVPETPSLNPTTGITLEAFINISRTPTSNAIAGLQFGSLANNSFQLGLRPALFFGLTNPLPQSFDVNSSFVPTSDRWYHVAGTWDGAMMRLFVDGAEIGSTPFSGPIGYSGVNALLIGADNDAAGEPGSSFFPGRIDEVRLLDHAILPDKFLNVVPEPSSCLLAGIGLGFVGLLRRRRQNMAC